MYSSKECRRRAVACERMADALAKGSKRRAYAEMAAKWLNLAQDIERAENGLRMPSPPILDSARAAHSNFAEGVS
jgi:hypothetical protein